MTFQPHPILVALLQLTCAAASAQVVEQRPAPSSPEQPQTIVITATKSAQPLAQTANSVTVLDASAVEARRIRTLEDLPAAVPNLQLNNSLGAGTLGYLTIRGLGNGPGSWDPAATILIDDVPFNDFFGYTASLIDVQRIEVLRGPQGTLYGGFAEAGVIDIRSRLPGLSFGGFGALELSSRATARGSMSLSAPLAGKTFRLGLAALAEQGNGPIRNVATGENPRHRAEGVRLQAVIEPNASLEALVTLSEQRLKDKDGVQYLPLDRSRYNQVIAPSGLSTGAFELANDFAGERRGDTSSQSLRLTWKGPGVDVIGVAANRTFKGPFAFDFDFTPIAAPNTPGMLGQIVSDSAYNTTNRYVELRAQSAGAGKGSGAAGLRWVLGASRSEQSVQVLSDGVWPNGNAAFGIPAGGRFGFNDATGEGSNQALFGQARLRVLGDQLGLTAGLRREQADRSGVNRAVAFGTPAFEASSSTSRTLPKLGMDWRVDHHTTLYANWATGWRPGGVNLYANTSTFGGRTADPLTYGTQRTRTVEAGVNLRRADLGLELSAALFDTGVKDYQETVLTGTGTAYLANVPSVKIRGAEAELRWRVLPSVTVNAGIGLARARYDNYFFGSNLLGGKQLANRPDWNAQLGATWQQGPWSLGADLTGRAAFQSAYQSDGSTTRVPGHWAANVSTGYRSGAWTFTGSVQNLANKEYFLNSNYVVAGFQVPVGMTGAPRTVNLKARYDF
jgi:iron complex outermembrane recepter protein